VKRDAPSENAFIFGKKQAAFRRSIVARKRRKFVIEILKAQAETQRFGVLEK
jgi:hypothetical protein